MLSALPLAFFVASVYAVAIPHVRDLPDAAGMRLMTWNLRYDSKPDNITVAQTLASLPNPMVEPVFMGKTGEQPWSTRRVRVSQEIQSDNIVIAGFQEALVRQVNDMEQLLGSDWNWCGVGRDDGIAAGEFNPIFYNQTYLTLQRNETFWLSNTPFQVSKYPGAGSYRIANLAHFSVPSTGKGFTLINTHLDDQSEAEREVGASLILYRARYEAANTGQPVLLTGDFNSYQSGNQSGAYQIVTGQIPPVTIAADFAAKYAVPPTTLPNFTMTDFRAATPRVGVSGFFRSFTGFLTDGQSSYGRIDYIFGGSNGGWDAIHYKTGNSVTDDGIMASDHRPVFVDVNV